MRGCADRRLGIIRFCDSRLVNLDGRSTDEDTVSDEFLKVGREGESLGVTCSG